VSINTASDQLSRQLNERRPIDGARSCVFGIATLSDSAIRVTIPISNPCRCKTFSPKVHVGSRANSALYSVGIRVLSLRQSGRNVNVTTHCHIVPKLTKGGATPCLVRDDFYFASNREIYSNKSRRQKKKLFPGKIKGYLHRFDVSESKYGDQNTL
jgi:hypothetical protein